MYKDNTQNIQKGHLVPASTYSFDCIYMVSTFKYTNAVPQYKSFNEGPWKVYEDRVRLFAASVCYPAGGDLYLLTGTSEAVLTAHGFPKQPDPLTYFPHNNPTRWDNIVIPNSMWTAGCCILRNGGIVGGFAAIGNNVQVNSEMHQKKVAELQDILATGIGGVGATINLFPGNEGCSKNLQQFRYEEGGTHPGWTKVIKLK
ncbi:endonuclease domain-containing 1 protein-like [Actinia tenebrosa]|uniref:Endonuclease domain-containing 1 protein-like n=1 Tax=Actinia tenebrosa TaxID=6105 RepID=A0A6P8J4Z9_ACTTE|nr:endonuclease domain-containing 1 protein-like [Actinia tenebrosa]